MESDKINMALDDIIKNNNKKGRGNKRNSFSRRENNKSVGFRPRKSNNFGDRDKSSHNTYYKSNFIREEDNSFRNRNIRNRNFRKDKFQDDLKPFNKPDWRRNDNENSNFNSERNNFRNNRRNRRFSNNQGSKIIVSNLHYNISNDDLANLFSEFGRIKKCGIFWDKVGVSKGEAYVEYYNRKDAESAINEMNGKIVEGLNINVELKSY